MIFIIIYTISILLHSMWSSFTINQYFLNQLFYFLIFLWLHNFTTFLLELSCAILSSEWNQTRNWTINNITYLQHENFFDHHEKNSSWEIKWNKKFQKTKKFQRNLHHIMKKLKKSCRTEFEKLKNIRFRNLIVQKQLRS